MTTRNWTAGPGDWSALEALGVLVDQRNHQDQLIAARVAGLRATGVPWRAIADSLDITTQAAQQRYR